MRKLIPIAVLALLIVSSERPALAGIQNVQSALATEAPEGLSGTVKASADWRTGNISFLFLAANAALRFRKGPHLGVVLVRGERKTSGDAVIVSRTFEHLRYRYDISERLLGEAFLQHEFDGVKRVNIRAVAGAGPRLSIVESDRIRAGIGVAYMLEYERIQDDGELDAGDSEIAHRASSYLAGSYALAERVQLVETFYIQPRLTDASDYRLLSETSAVIKATKKVSISTSFNIAYDSSPPETIKKTDSALITSVTVEF